MLTEFIDCFLVQIPRRSLFYLCNLDITSSADHNTGLFSWICVNLASVTAHVLSGYGKRGQNSPFNEEVKALLTDISFVIYIVIYNPTLIWANFWAKRSFCPRWISLHHRWILVTYIENKSQKVIMKRADACQ